ncbi:LysO family transporter [Ilyobacter polytropus]|uniref:DUF340 domain-containing protein n=1 Tax=Ilyobacter polytropus (strain ATCC 51220 / DSM 2926 / LMG 16218 / CuHBu1) TaxID=572544 RepID=E3H9V2_ILYPC|nr:LysO family transporter [Ilyobacter polytropus]ADO83631.1 conserved hypothetical protein [Ilyobacter polytropus DSM 2926]
MRIIFYIAIILFGYIMGSKKLFPEKLENRLSAFQNICLLFLLGIMGYKIGANKDIIKNFSNIGIKSLIISSLCIFFSVLFVKILCRNIKK